MWQDGTFRAALSGTALEDYYLGYTTQRIQGAVLEGQISRKREMIVPSGEFFWADEEIIFREIRSFGVGKERGRRVEGMWKDGMRTRKTLP